jgi:hypothetical protein
MKPHGGGSEAIHSGTWVWFWIEEGHLFGQQPSWYALSLQQQVSWGDRVGGGELNQSGRHVQKFSMVCFLKNRVKTSIFRI